MSLPPMGFLLLLLLLLLSYRCCIPVISTMSNVNVANRMMASNRNIRQRCSLKYAKHGKLHWDKWSDYDCIFSLFVDANRNQRFQLEMHDENNLHQPNGYVIDLQDLRSVTYARGRPDKNEPDYIVTLQVKAKRHRFGFDENNTFNQWKSLLDTALNATASSTRKEEPTENEATNLLYESSNATTYRVRFADEATRSLLSLPDEPCLLIFDDQKFVLEQNQDKQYTIPRSKVRGIKKSENQIEFQMGARAPVNGSITFLFETTFDAEACYRAWSDSLDTSPIPQPPPRMRLSTRQSSKVDYDNIVQAPAPDLVENRMKPPPRAPRNPDRKSTTGSLEAPPRRANRSTYQNNNTFPSIVESDASRNDGYMAFHTPL